MNLPKIAALLCSVLLLLPLSACGKKGQLIPPEALVPAGVTDLSVAQRGGYLQVGWSAPSKEEGGSRLRDLAGFILYRRVLLPPDADCDTCPGAYAERSRIDINYPGDALKIGNRFQLDDYDIKLGQSYQYKVVSYSVEGAQSHDSNRAHHTVFRPPLPPVLEAHSSNTEITLNFVAIPPDEGKLTAYNIYRSKTGQTIPLTPMNSVPATENSFRDTALSLGVSYTYSVRAVATMPNGETVESALSNTAEGALAQPD